MQSSNFNKRLEEKVDRDALINAVFKTLLKIGDHKAASAKDRTKILFNNLRRG